MVGLNRVHCGVPWGVFWHVRVVCLCGWWYRYGVVGLDKVYCGLPWGVFWRVRVVCLCGWWYRYGVVGLDKVYCGVPCGVVRHGNVGWVLVLVLS